MNKMSLKCKCGTSELMSAYDFPPKNFYEAKMMDDLEDHSFEVITFVCHVCENKVQVAMRGDVYV